MMGMASTKRAKKTAGKRANKPQAVPRQSQPVWERATGESAKAYAAFLAYRDLGPERSLAKAARQTRRDISLLKRWSSRRAWVERAWAWDASQEREAQEQVRRQREESLRRQARDADRLQRLAMAKLGTLVRRNPASNELELDSQVTTRDAVLIYKLGLEIERSLLGETEDGVTEQPDNEELRRLTDEELRSLIELARQRVRSEAGEDEDEEAEEAGQTTA